MIQDHRSLVLDGIFDDLSSTHIGTNHRPNGADHGRRPPNNKRRPPNAKTNKNKRRLLLLINTHTQFTCTTELACSTWAANRGSRSHARSAIKSASSSLRRSRSRSSDWPGCVSGDGIDRALSDLVALEDRAAVRRRRRRLVSGERLGDRFESRSIRSRDHRDPRGSHLSPCSLSRCVAGR